MFQEQLIMRKKEKNKRSNGATDRRKKCRYIGSLEVKNEDPRTQVGDKASSLSEPQKCVFFKKFESCICHAQ